MRLVAVATCPLWEHDDGSRRVGLREELTHPPVVGWVNVAALDLDDAEHLLLLTLDAR